MVTKITMAVFTAGLLALGLSSAAMADAKAAIEARQACMKANGGMMKVMVPIIKGQKAYDKAAIDAAVDVPGQTIIRTRLTGFLDGKY